MGKAPLITTYFGERDRVDGTFLATALIDFYEREGFGAKHRLRTARLLTLSEDLPIVAVAVDTRKRISSATDRDRAQ